MTDFTFFDQESPDNALRRTAFTAIVAPRPIGWISTLGPDGVPNLAPFSFFNLVSTAPVMLMFAGSAPYDRAEKDSIANARRQGEFVYNLATVELAQQMVKSSGAEPYGVDEFVVAGLEKAACVKVRPPRVALSPVALECQVERIIDLAPRAEGEGASTVVLGRVVGVHIASGLLDARGRFDTVAADPLSRLGGDQYATLGRILEIPSIYHQARR